MGLDSWRVQRERTAQVLLFLVTTYAMLLLLNAVLPLVLPPQLLGRANAVGLPDGLQIPHEQLGYAYPPHWQGEFLGKPDERVAITTNADGWRDEEFGPSGAGEPRMLVLGDSITMGVGVEAEERYSERLEDWLPGGQVDTCAAAGYELNQLVVLARLMLPRTQPDIVLYGFCINDIRVADIEAARAVEQTSRKLKIKSALELRHLGRFIDNVKLLRRESKLSRTGPRPAELLTMKRWEDAAQRDDFAQRLDELQRLCDEAGATLGVVVFPYTFQFDKPGDDPVRAPQRHLAAMLESRGIPYLDLFETLQAATTGVFLPMDNCHPNAEGHGIVAEAVLAWMKDEGLVETVTSARNSTAMERVAEPPSGS